MAEERGQGGRESALCGAMQGCGFFNPMIPVDYQPHFTGGKPKAAGQRK